MLVGSGDEIAEQPHRIQAFDTTGMMTGNHANRDDGHRDIRGTDV